MCVTPTPGVQQVTVISIEVQEYRNGVLIGSIVRDIQVQVLPCPGNNVPQLTGYDQLPINSFNTDTSICPNELLNVNIDAFDLDTNNLTLSWNSGISDPSAIMTFINNGTDSASANFQWTPSLSDTSTSPYCFTLTVADDACPIFSTFTFSYCITVGGNPTTLAPFPIVCENGASLALSGGSPIGGVYSGVGVASGLFNPTVAGVGTHTIEYNYISNTGCIGNSFQDIEVIEEPWAGIDGSTTLCTGDGPVDLFSFLDGGPQLGGVWKDPSGNVMNSSIIDPLSDLPGSYTYTVYNPPCIEDISTVVVSFNLFPFSAQVTNVSCPGSADGIIDILVNTGVAPFQYSIDGGQNFQFNNVFDQLESGEYIIVVLDGNNCSASQYITVAAPSAQIAVIANGSDAACSGTSSGDVWIESIVGGLPYDTGFAYTWYSTDDNSIVGYGGMLSGIPYGGYYVIAQDSIGCTGSSSVTVTESTGFTLDIQKTEPICVGGQEGSIYVGVTGGGVPPYTYDWSASTNNPADTFSTLYNLIAGSYSLTITDSYDCDTTILVTLLEPSLALSVQAEAIQSISCFEDSTGIARALVVGGQSPYSYAWSGGHALDTAWGLWSSDHDVIVTDARGCSESSSITITSNTAIESELSSTPTTCYGYSDGSAEVISTTGGVTPYQYIWSNGQSSSGISNLSFGQYTLQQQTQ